MKKNYHLLQTLVFGITSIGLLSTHMTLAADGDVEILAVQAGLLAPSVFGGGKGELPNHLRMASNDLGDWPSGTGVLLRIKPPEGAKLALNEFKLVSFSDDGGKDLTKAPEGMQTERGSHREFEPVTAVYDEKNGELYIAVRSQRAPSRNATMVQGEVQVAVAGGLKVVESALFTPSSKRSEVKVGSFIFEIDYYGPPRHDRNQQWGDPSGRPSGRAPRMPTPPMGTKEFSYSMSKINSGEKSEEESTVKMLAMELLNSNGKQIFKKEHDDITFGGSHSISSPSLHQDGPPFKFRVTIMDAAKVQFHSITFKTTIGVSE